MTIALGTATKTRTATIIDLKEKPEESWRRGSAPPQLRSRLWAAALPLGLVLDAPGAWWFASRGERHHLVQIQLTTEKALAGAKARGDIARAWITHYEETLDGVRKALAVDQDPGVADGGLVTPFAGGRRRR